MTGYPRARASPKRRVSAYAAAPRRRVPYTRALHAAVPTSRASQMRNHLVSVSNSTIKTTPNITTTTLGDQRGHRWDSSQTANTPDNDLTLPPNIINSNITSSNSPKPSNVRRRPRLQSPLLEVLTSLPRRPPESLLPEAERSESHPTDLQKPPKRKSPSKQDGPVVRQRTGSPTTCRR